MSSRFLFLIVAGKFLTLSLPACTPGGHLASLPFQSQPDRKSNLLIEILPSVHKFWGGFSHCSDTYLTKATQGKREGRKEGGRREGRKEEGGREWGEREEEGK